MSHNRRVVLTGMGVISPLGLDLATFRARLREGKNAVRSIRAFDPSGLPIRIAAELDQFDPRHYLEKKDRKSLKMMAPTVQLAVAAARLAMDDARLPPLSVDPCRLGVAFGVGTVPGALADLGPASRASFDPTKGAIDLNRWGTDGMAQMAPMWMLNHVPNMAACHVSILHNAQGPNNTITQSDAASLLALGEAVNVIQRDAADVLLAGGADIRAALVPMIRYPLFTSMSRRNEEPDRTPRPFDLDRDGQVMGDGSSVLIVEELQHARRRQAHIYAEVLGFAAGFDHGRTGAGLARVIRLALDRAGLSAQELDHLNAHAPGTIQDDRWEALGIAKALGDLSIPVLAVKSYFGNLGTASSSTELLASVLSLQEGWRPATVNHENTDPQCPILVARDPAPARTPFLLKIAATEIGQCAALVLRCGEV